jgi:hypothetical protein
MKKVLILTMLFFINSFAVLPFSYKWTIRTTGADTATQAKWRANNDSVLNFGSRVTDTINIGLAHLNLFTSPLAYTFKYMNIDTIPSADTVFTKNLKVTKIDSISHMTMDSLKSKTAIFTKNVTMDTLKANKLDIGGKTDYLSVDSITIGGGSLLKSYISESWSCHLYDSIYDSANTTNAHYAICGKVATVTIPQLTHTLPGSRSVYLQNFPTAISAGYWSYVPVVVITGSATQNGLLFNRSTTKWEIYTTGSGYLANGTGGIGGLSFSFIIP